MSPVKNSYPVIGYLFLCFFGLCNSCVIASEKDLPVCLFIQRLCNVFPTHPSLAYGSQKEARHYRLMRKADMIKERLGGKSGRDYPFPWKPMNMHWKTYWRLRKEAEKAENLGWMIVGQQFILSVK
ncbi:MAG: hypothetical protein KJ862_21365 [Proteobacteria bacterium]|nr:hypothetical protein [Pseudomonadota bacterium]